MTRGRAARGLAAVGVALGGWIGVIDGGRVVLRHPEWAGGLIDRVGTAFVSVGLDAAAAGIVGAALGVALAPWLPERLARVRGHGFALAAAVLVAGAIAALAPRGAAGGADRTNVLLVSVDTLRADHLSSYGYARETDPNLARLARAGAVFEQTWASSHWTLPSHASLLTGLDPPAHGVTGLLDALPPALPTLAETLRAAGYHTGAWVGTTAYGYVGAEHGLAAGFDRYRHFPHPRRWLASALGRRIDRLHFQHLRRGIGNATAQVDSVLAWLRNARREPFFLFLHFYDVHSRYSGKPYEAPEPFLDRFCPGEVDDFDGCPNRGYFCATQALNRMAKGKARRYSDADLAKVRCLYDGGIAYVDFELGRIFDALAQLGLAERTALVVTSDHGEAFFEHELPLHETLHEEVARVPLLFAGPRVPAGARVRTPVELMDVMPTLLELVGVDAAGPMQGRSLLPLIEGRSDDTRPVHSFGTSAAAIRRGPYKLIRPETGDALELYHLERDPAELTNLAIGDADAAKRLERALIDATRTSEALGRELHGGSEVRIEVPDEERERLRALGYGD